MSSKQHKNNPGDFVTKAECRAEMGGIRADVTKIKDALIGEDMQGGLVKKVNDLLKERGATTEILRTVVAPILAAVVSAVLTAWLLTGGHL